MLVLYQDRYIILKLLYLWVYYWWKPSHNRIWMSLLACNGLDGQIMWKIINLVPDLWLNLADHKGRAFKPLQAEKLKFEYVKAFSNNKPINIANLKYCKIYKMLEQKFAIYVKLLVALSWPAPWTTILANPLNHYIVLIKLSVFVAYKLMHLPSSS